MTLLVTVATAADFNLYLDAAATAFSNGDTAEARKQITLARFVLPQLPRTSSDGTSIDYASGKEQLDSLERSVTGQTNGGVARSGVEF